LFIELGLGLVWPVLVFELVRLMMMVILVIKTPPPAVTFPRTRTSEW